MTEATGLAWARSALLGNPSDVYGGRAIGFAFENFVARVSVAKAPDPITEPAEVAPLVEAIVNRLRRHCSDRGFDLPRSALSVRCETTIPREVGLGGSSALVIAALRAICGLHGFDIPAASLAALALSVEQDELGIPAGPLDRVAQAHGGLVYMDFSPEIVAAAGDGVNEALDPALLPPLLIAYRLDAAEASSQPHTELRRRVEAGQEEVIRTLREIAELARLGRDALLARDHDVLRHLVDRNFELRRQLYPLEPRHVRMVELARELGASANYAGSGGAIVAVPHDGFDPVEAERSFAAGGCTVIRPKV